MGRGWDQDFTGGTTGVAAVMLADGTPKAFVVSGPMLRAYMAYGGAEGRLGYPVAEQVATAGGLSQAFQNESIELDSSG